MGNEVSNLGKSVNIDNSILHLFQTDNNELLFKKLLKVPQIDFNTKVNFRDDTFLHYACSRNNKDLVKYILFKNGNPYAKNIDGVRPIDMTTDEEIKETIENYANEFLNQLETHQSTDQPNLIMGLLANNTSQENKINQSEENKFKKEDTGDGQEGNQECDKIRKKEDQKEDDIQGKKENKEGDKVGKKEDEKVENKESDKIKNNQNVIEEDKVEKKQSENIGDKIGIKDNETQNSNHKNPQNLLLNNEAQLPETQTRGHTEQVHQDIIS